MRHFKLIYSHRVRKNNSDTVMPKGLEDKILAEGTVVQHIEDWNVYKEHPLWPERECQASAFWFHTPLGLLVIYSGAVREV